MNLRESNAQKALASDDEGEDGYEVEIPEGVVPGDIIRIDLDSGGRDPSPQGAVPGTKLTALPSGVVVRCTPRKEVTRRRGRLGPRRRYKRC